MHLHEYISRALSPFLARWISKEAMISNDDNYCDHPLGRSPGPSCHLSAIKSHYPQLLLRNPPISDAETNSVSFKPISSSITCFAPIDGATSCSVHRQYGVNLPRGKPLLSLEDYRETIDNAAHILLYRKGKISAVCGREFKRCFRTANQFHQLQHFDNRCTGCQQDMLAIIPSRFYNLFSRCWPLKNCLFRP